MGERASPAVYFLSDYGTEDEFVGVVHAVLHRLAPGVSVIDITHAVTPFDVGEGAATLVRSVPHLGRGVVLAVVDPGVGTARRGLAVEVRSTAGSAAPSRPGPTGADRGDRGDGPARFVGPDNGLLVPPVTAVGGPVQAFALRIPAGAGRWGPTFDGRDLFAPVAAHLALGRDPAEVGARIDPGSLVPAPEVPTATVDGHILRTESARVDRFGNVALRAGRGELDALGMAVGGAASVEIGGSSRPARRVVGFADLRPGELGLLVDGAGQVALVLDRAPASALVGIETAGRPVTIARPT